ncbi:hypothetical protein CGC49_09625 [Capnocytophaga sp. H4358]|nr:hypothetical protein CGC49_09625 [Capnocytophaga sp. H4358]
MKKDFEIMKIDISYKYLVLLIFSLFVSYVHAQRIESISLGFSDACVSDSYNNFGVSFKWQPPLPNATNQYIIELSDANGDFSNPVTLATLTGQNTQFEYSVNVQFPNTMHGDAYRIRVSSTNPSSSITSNPFSAYYVNVNSPMELNGGVSNINLCPGHSQEISVNKKGEKAYKWYRNNTLIPGETKHTLRVSEAGTYHAVVDYGNYCSGSSNSRSNNVTVVMGGSLGVVITNSISGNNICKGQPFTLTASVNDSNYLYKWYRNGTVVQQGAGMHTYTAPTDDTAAGSYKLGISVPGSTCEELTNEIEIKFRENFTVSATVQGDVLILPGGTKKIEATTTAESPSYQWKLNGAPIQGATEATYQARQPGEYTVEVTQGGSCAGVLQTSNKVLLESPNEFKVEIRYKSSGYQPCMFDKATLGLAKIIAVTPSGEVLLEASSYSAFTYQWYKDDQALDDDDDNNDDDDDDSGFELTLNKATQNGNYSLKIATPGVNNIQRSNSLPVQLTDPNAVQLNGGQTSLEVCAGAVTLTASPLDVNATYTWYKDGVKVSEGAGVYEYGATQMGTYYVAMSGTSEACPATSNSLVLVKREIRANWVLPQIPRAFIPGKTYVLTISHNMNNPTIKWFRNGTEIQGVSAPTYSVTEPGAYHAEVESSSSGCAGSKIVLPLQSYIEIKELKPNIGFAEVQSQNCDGTATQTTLKLKKLEAVLEGGEVVLIGNEGDETDYQYFSFQWLRNDAPIMGQSDPTGLVVTKEDALTGSYSLLAIYQTIIDPSNKLNVSFSTIPDITLVSESDDDSPKICEGGSTIIKAPIDSEAFSYQWYKGAVPIEGAVEATYEATEVGDYYLRISNGACTKQSTNIVKVSVFDPSSLKLVRVNSDGVEISEVPSGSRVTASKGEVIKVVGGNSKAENYLWSTPSNSVFAQEIIIKETGDYVLTATIGGTCSPVELRFSAEVFEISKIPNVVTPNGDGSNDFWEIPEDYLNKDNVKVSIYSQEGKAVFSGTRFTNKTWPNVETYKELGKRALIFMYIIEVDNKVDKQGTITLFR